MTPSSDDGVGRAVLLAGLMAAMLQLTACGDESGQAPGELGSGTGGTGGAVVGVAGSGGVGGSAGQAATSGGGTAGTSGQSATSGGTGAAGTSGSAAPSAGASGGAGSMSAGSGGAAGSEPMTCSGSTLAAGESERTIQVEGTSRSYVLFVPDGYDGTTPVPLVLDFHGLGGSGSGQRRTSGMAALSDRDGFVIAFPDGIDNAWNVGPCCTTSRDVDDVGFVRAIIAELSSEGCIDSKRVYATGFSMGGGISHFLACHAADVLAAVTPHAFDLLEENEGACLPARPISVLSFRGTNDFLVPYDGGESTPPNGCCPPIHFLGAAGTLAKWVELAECTGTPTTSGDTQLYTQCAGGVEVGLHTLQGGGHTPGPAEAAWDFLQTKSLP